MKDKNSACFLQGNYIIKDINRIFNISHIPDLQNALNDKGINCPKIERYNVLNDNHIRYKYKYIEGEIVKYASSDLICAIKDFINAMNENTEYFNTIISYYDKINEYFNRLYNIVANETLDIVLELNRYYIKIKEKYTCQVLSHCDLDFSNIIFSNNNYIFIDFDECCIAPKELDWAIFVTRQLYKKYGNSLIDKMDLKACNIDMIVLYCIKVIIEKIYLIEYDIIDISDVNQKSDSYKDWLCFLRTVLKSKKYDL